MSRTEFEQWMALETIEPSEPHRGDARAALICYTMVNSLRQVFGAKGKGPEFKDFLLKFELKDLERIPYEELEVKMKGWLHGMKDAQDKRKAKKRGKHRKHSSDVKPK